MSFISFISITGALQKVTESSIPVLRNYVKRIQYRDVHITKKVKLRVSVQAELQINNIIEEVKSVPYTSTEEVKRINTIQREVALNKNNPTSYLRGCFIN